MVEIVYDKDAGLRLAEKLVSSNNALFLNRVPPPELRYSHGFERGSLGIVDYLFRGSILDGQRLSRKVYRFSHILTRDYPNNSDIVRLYNTLDLDYLALKNKKRNLLEKVLSANLDNGGSLKPSELLRDMAVKLDKDYDGDVRGVLRDIRNYDDAEDLVRSFRGIGEQKAPLLIKNLVRFGYMEFDNPYDVAMKVDRHMLRMCIGNGVVNFEGLEEGDVEIVHLAKVGRHLKQMFREIIRENEFDSIVLCDSKWGVGERYCNKKDLKTCENDCKLDCTMYVELEAGGTYAVIPSDTRIDVEAEKMKELVLAKIPNLLSYGVND